MRRFHRSFGSSVLSILFILVGVVNTSARLGTQIGFQAGSTTKISVVNPETGLDEFIFNSSVVQTGGRFIVNITVTNVTGLFAWQIKLCFNNRFLKLTDTFLPRNHVFANRTVVEVQPSSPFGNYTMYGLTLRGKEPTFNGTGTLCQVRFEVLEVPEELGFVSCKLNITNKHTYLLSYPGIEEIPCDKQNGCYEYDVFPFLSVKPDRYTASCVGEIFDVNVTVDCLEFNDSLVRVEFKLNYNESLLEAISVTEGLFLNEFGNTTFQYGVEENGMQNVTVKNELTQCIEFPRGSGTLAIIRFNVTKGPPAYQLACNLQLDSVVFYNNVSEQIPQSLPRHGHYSLQEKIVHGIMWPPEDGKIYLVLTVSNVSVSPVSMVFRPEQKELVFNVTGVEGAVGWLNVTIPQVLLNASSYEDWDVRVDDEKINFASTVNGYCRNETHWSLYFRFESSTKIVRIRGASTLDFTPPTIIILSPGNITYRENHVPLNFSVNEGTSWIGYSLNQQTNVTISENKTMYELSEGTHTVIVYANDTIGNMGFSETAHFSVDTVAPTIEILSPENKTYASSSVPFSFTVSESTSWVKYSLDGQANITVTGNTTLTGLSDGVHCVIAYGNDTVGNVGFSNTVYFTVQTGEGVAAFTWIITGLLVVAAAIAIGGYVLKRRKT